MIIIKVLLAPSEDRMKGIKSALLSTNQHGASLDVYAKDHKVLGEDGLMKTRPLSNCIGSISEPLGGLLVLSLDKIQENDTNLSSVVQRKC